MAQLFRLEEFALAPAGPAAEDDPFAGMVPEAEVEAARMEGYDRGYRSGWDDAVAAASQARSHVAADFARNLQDLSFTYHEARAHVLRGIEPLLEEILAVFLPKSVQALLARTVLDELTEMAKDAADAPVRVMVSPADAPVLRELIGDNRRVPLSIVEEPSLAEGQVYLRLGETERAIDLSGALLRMSEALRGASDLNGRILKHG